MEMERSETAVEWRNVVYPGHVNTAPFLVYPGYGTLRRTR